MNNKIVTDPEAKDKMAKTPPKNVAISKPNETGGIYVMTHLQISDPNTKQILVKKRGDD